MDDFSLFAGTTNRIGEMIDVFQNGIPRYSEAKGVFITGDLILFDQVTIKTPSDNILLESINHVIIRL